MTLYLLLAYLNSLRRVEPTPELKIKCKLKFEGLSREDAKTLDKYMGDSVYSNVS